jgi:hypothetical protein
MSFVLKELQRRKLHHIGPQANSAHHFTSKTFSQEKTYAAGAENRVPETPPTDTRR